MKGAEAIWSLMVALLFLVYVTTYAFSAITIDTGRDWMQAWQIASGSTFPTAGPALKVDVFHFGPIWFYLLGGFFYLSQSITTTSLLIGLLAGLKFPLAYWCGQRLLDRQLGLLWALALAIPGWQLMEQAHVTHTNLVETTVLLVLYMLVRFAREGGNRWVVGIGFSFSIALHAHPSTAPIGLLILIVFIYRATLFRDPMLLPVLGAITLFLIPFSPYLVSQSLQGWPEWQNAARYIQGETGASNLLSLPALIWSIVVDAPKVLSQSNFQNPLLAKLWLAGVYCIYLIVTAGLLWMLLTNKRKRLIILGLLSLLVVATGVLYLRPQTPYYMTYVLYPFLAFLVALVMRELLGNAGNPGKSVFVVAASLVMLSVTVSAAMVQVHRSGEGKSPRGVFMNIASFHKGEFIRTLRFPAFNQDDLGEYICQQVPNVAMHGDIAFIVDTTFGIGARLNCDADLTLTIGNSTAHLPGLHLAGLSRQLWDSLEQSPKHWIGPVGITEPMEVLSPEHGVALAGHHKYPPRELSNDPLNLHSWQITLRASRTLVISNPFLWYLPVKGLRVTLAGKEIQPSIKNRISTLYDFTMCRTDDPCVVEVQLRTPKREWINIFTI